MTSATSLIRGDKRNLERDIIGWDRSNWSRALDFWRTHSRFAGPGCSALEIGAGPGGLSLWLASLGFEVICSDLRPRASAPTLHARYGATGISYRALNVTALPYRDALDVICFKSVLGGVGAYERKDRQAKATNQMWLALKPGGEVWFAENLMGAWPHQYARRRWTGWGSRWRWVTVEEIREFFRPFRGLEYVTFGVLGAFGRREWQRSALAAVDHWLSPWLPARWHYIVAGVARK